MTVAEEEHRQRLLELSRQVDSIQKKLDRVLESQYYWTQRMVPLYDTTDHDHLAAPMMSDAQRATLALGLKRVELNIAHEEAHAHRVRFWDTGLGRTALLTGILAAGTSTAASIYGMLVGFSHAVLH